MRNRWGCDVKLNAGAILSDRVLKHLKHLRFCGLALFCDPFSFFGGQTLENHDRDARKEEDKKEHDGNANRTGIGGIPQRNDGGGESGKTVQQMAERHPHVRLRVSRSPRIAILAQHGLRPVLRPLPDVSQLLARLFGAEARWNRSYRFGQ